MRSYFPVVTELIHHFRIMAFDPSKPAHDSTITSAELRDQFNALAALIDDLRTRLDALPGRGTDAFVSMAGNDAMAVLGDPARPFRTAQAAFDAAVAAGGERVLRFGNGDFGGIVLGADWPEQISLAGAGATVTRLGGIVGNGAPGVAGTDETADCPATPGTNGGNGSTVRVATDGMIHLGVIVLNGGTGGDGGKNLDGTYPPNNGGGGGTGGTLELTGCVLGEVYASGAGYGQPGFNGPGGFGGTVPLVNCTVGAITANGGAGTYGQGMGGTATLMRCIYAGVNLDPGGTFNDIPTAPGSGVSSNVVR